MNGFVNFFTRLWPELRRSLNETLNLFESGGRDWTVVLATGVTRLIVSLLLVLIFAVAYLLLRGLLAAVLRRLSVNQELARFLRTALRYALTVLAGLAVMSQYGISTTVTGAIFRAAFVLLLFFGGRVVVNQLLRSYLGRQQLDPSLVQLLSNVTSVVIIVFALTTVLAQFGVNVFSIITTLGVVGIAVGFAAQETLSNLIAGITLLLERPFRIGHWVRLGALEGKVVEINLRTTRMLTRDNEVMVIPNATMAASDLVDLTAGGPLRVRIPLGIAYKEQTGAARAVLMPLLRNHPKVMAQPEPRVRMIELGDSSLNLEMVYWLAPGDVDVAPSISFELLEAGKGALDTAGIEIPFPHLQLFVDSVRGVEPLAERIMDSYLGHAGS